MHSNLSNNRMECLEFGILWNLNGARVHQGEQVPFVIGQVMIEQRLFTIFTLNLEDRKLEMI